VPDDAQRLGRAGADPERLAQRRGQARHQAGLGVGEGGLALAAQQGDGTPGAPAHAEHRPKLVVEPVRAQEPPVTAARPGVAGGGPQGGHRNPGAGDVAVQVDVLEQQLPAPELRAGVGVAQVEAFHPRRGRGQPGVRVGRQPHGRVEWDQPAQAGRGFGEDGGGVVGSLDPENELVTPPPEGGGSGHRHALHGCQARRGPQPRKRGGLPWPVPAIGGWEPAARSATLGRW
jgi:hypothetical protein